MARSPHILAASVTAALPGTGVVGVGTLTENGAGRFDSAVARLADGREVVVRTPNDEEAAADLAAESRALRALTAGVRALLPFRVPEVIGEAGSGVARVLVVDRLDGYRVDPVHLPKGSGFATAIGAALAAVHALPASIVRTDGLPVRTPQQVRDDVARLLDRSEATRRVPGALIERWRGAVAVDELWRFESAVVLGGATSASFLLADDGETARVTGLLDWAGLSVGDPATDLRWLASAPIAADDVFAGYVAEASRAPDALLRERARMYAELEFAKWLVHGHDDGRTEVVDDAIALLEALAEGVGADDLVPEARPDVDAALAFAYRIPDTASGADTSMQTDAYDPQMMSLFVAAERDSRAAAAAPDFGLDGLREPEDQPTAPIDMVGWASARDDDPNGAVRGADAADALPTADAGPAADARPTANAHRAAEDAPLADDEDLRDEAQRATRAALRRWGATGDDDARLGQHS